MQGDMMKAVLFDLDRTLLDRDSAVIEYAERLWERWKSPADAGQSDFVSRFVELDARGYGDKRALFQVLVLEFLAGCEAEALHEEFAENLSVPPFADALSVLQALRKQGLLLGVITNGGSKAQRAKLANSGLLPLLDIVLVSEEVGFKKPVPEIFQAALQALHCRAADAVFVGDSEQGDIRGAKAVRMLPVLRRYAGENFATEAHREVWSLNDLLALPKLASERPDRNAEKSTSRGARDIFQGFRR